jgi:hypothetical protein
VLDNLALLPAKRGVTKNFVENFERSGHLSGANRGAETGQKREEKQRDAGHPNFTNAFGFRPLLLATLASRPAKKARYTDEKKAAQSKLDGFAG